MCCKGGERGRPALADHFGTFSFTCFSSQDGDNEAAAKSYSEPMCASVNTKQRACSYDLRGELPLLLIIHETSCVAIWRQHRRQWSFTAKESNMRCKLARAGKKNEQQSQENHLRGGCEEETRARGWLRTIFISLSVVHTKKVMGKHLSVCYWTRLKKYYTLSRGSKFGSGCFQEGEWKSSVACVDCPSHSQRLGADRDMDMLPLADPFPAQKPQDCVVVGGGNHVQELQGKTLRWRWEEWKVKGMNMFSY